MSEGNEISAESVVEAIFKEDKPEYVLDGKTITGKFDLMHRIISVAITITNCTFEDEVDLSYAEFKQCVDFSGGIFRKKFNNDSTIYQKDIICKKAIFEDEVCFNTSKCGLVGNFVGTKFENAEKEIDFVGAEFGAQFNCTEAIFKGGANFNSIQCEDSGFFINAHFENVEKDVDFGRARFSVDLDCTGAEFKGGANFNSFQCEGNGFFGNAHFDNMGKETDFSYTIFGGNLELTNATFAGNISFFHAQVSGSFVLIDTTFQKDVSLYCANLHTFRLEDSSEENDSGTFKGKVDLRRFTFTIFHGDDKQQKHVLESQSPKVFSIDPYLQFEKYYSSIGDDSNAKRVYYKGRSELRKNARHGFAIRRSKVFFIENRNPDIRWSLGKLILDCLIMCILVGYGVKLGRSFGILIVALFLGAIFWSDEAMIPKSAIANNPELIMIADNEQQKNLQNDLKQGTLSIDLRKKLQIPDLAHITIAKNGSEWDINSDSSKGVTYKAKVEGNEINIYRITNFKPKSFLYKLGYSLDMLLPIADLKIADEYKFPSDWYGFYIVMHTILGWILIPLLISSLAGVLRKRG